MSDEDDDFDGEEDEEKEGGGTAFDDDTEGRLVAGRSFELGGMTGGQVTALGAAIQALAERTKLPLELVPGGDFTGTGPSADDTLYSECAIGLPAGRGGTFEADAIKREAALERLAAAKGISSEIWGEIAGLLPEKPRESFRASEIELWLVCVGPLAAATLAFGVEGSEDDEDMPGEYHGGQDMEQEPFESGVWGIEVGHVEYEGEAVIRVDLSDEAHERLTAELGRSGGDYYLLARYD